jgi:tRNA 2-thiouridine synthesizing protein A
VNVDLDCRGLLCPLPVIKLAKTLPTVAIGDTVTVLADDPAAATDIPAWCRMRSQELVSAADERYVVRRAGQTRP